VSAIMRPRARAHLESVPSATEAEIGSLAGGYGHLFRRAHMLFGEHYIAHFAKEGVQITPVLGGMLILIDEHPGLSQIKLARLMRIEGPSMWQNVARLIDLGYIEHRRADSDRRAFKLRLSPRGRAVLARVRRGMSRHQLVLLSALSEKERESLKSMLLRVIDHGEHLKCIGATKSDRLRQENARDDHHDAQPRKVRQSNKRGAKDA